MEGGLLADRPPLPLPTIACTHLLVAAALLRDVALRAPEIGWRRAGSSGGRVGLEHLMSTNRHPFTSLRPPYPTQYDAAYLVLKILAPRAASPAGASPKVAIAAAAGDVTIRKSLDACKRAQAWG